MMGADHDTTDPASTTSDGKAHEHVAWRLWAVASAALMDLAEITALGRLGVLVDRYLMCDAGTGYDDLPRDGLLGVLIPAHWEKRTYDAAADSSRGQGWSRACESHSPNQG